MDIPSVCCTAIRVLAITSTLNIISIHLLLLTVATTMSSGSGRASPVVCALFLS